MTKLTKHQGVGALASSRGRRFCFTKFAVETYKLDETRVGFPTSPRPVHLAVNEPWSLLHWNRDRGLVGRELCEVTGRSMSSTQHGGPFCVPEESQGTKSDICPGFHAWAVHGHTDSEIPMLCFPVLFLAVSPSWDIAKKAEELFQILERSHDLVCSFGRRLSLSLCLSLSLPLPPPLSLSCSLSLSLSLSSLPLLPSKLLIPKIMRLKHCLAKRKDAAFVYCVVLQKPYRKHRYFRQPSFCGSVDALLYWRQDDIPKSSSCPCIWHKCWRNCSFTSSTEREFWRQVNTAQSLVFWFRFSSLHFEILWLKYSMLM